MTKPTDAEMLVLVREQMVADAHHPTEHEIAIWQQIENIITGKHPEWRQSQWGITYRRYSDIEISAHRGADSTSLLISETGEVPKTFLLPNDMADILAAQLAGKKIT